MSKKSSFLFIIIFFSCQVFIDLLHSVTVFPFLHYGMYSESFAKPANMEVFEITANGKTLDAADFRINVWDMIHTPLSGIGAQAASADFSFDKKKMADGLKLVGLKKIYAMIETNLNNDPALNNRFAQWYKAYLERVLGYPVLTLEVNKIYYNYDREKYIMLKKEKWINI